MQAAQNSAAKVRRNDGVWPALAQLVVAGALMAGGAAYLLERRDLLLPIGVTAGLLLLAILAGWVRRSRRNTTTLRLAETVAPIFGRGADLGRAIRVRRWRGGQPTDFVISYSAGFNDGDPAARDEVVETLSRKLGAPLRADWKPAADRVRLRVTPPRTAPPAAAAGEESAEAVTPVQRAQQVAASMLSADATVLNPTYGADGTLTSFTVAYPTTPRDGSPAARERITDHFSRKLPGRWRSDWDPGSDRVHFELRPGLPDVFPHPVLDHTQVFGPGSLMLPFAVDEDGRYIGWDLNAATPHGLVIGPTGGGKFLALDTPIATPSGWTSMGELKDGDQVFDDAGNACTVVQAHEVQHGQDCYEVVFSDGSVLVAGGEHLWWTEDRADRRARFDHRDVDDRRDTPRRRRLADDALARLAAAVTTSQPEDTITLPEVARLAGISDTHTILRRIAGEIGPAGTRPAAGAVAFTYREQTVVQEQKVSLFDRASALAFLAHRATSPAWPFAITGAQPGEVLAAAAEQSTEISSLDLRRRIGADKNAFHAVMRRSGVPRRAGRQKVGLHVPGRTVTRRPPRPHVVTYPAGPILAKLITWGEGLMRDRRRVRPSGAVRTTEEILATLRTAGGGANHAVPVARAVQYPEAQQPIPAYVLGVWLGDGTSRSAEITSADPAITDLIEDAGVEVVDRGRPATLPITYRARTYSLRGIRRHLDELGLLRGADPVRVGRSKHIPGSYLIASVQQRRALLAGLLDTDGTVAHSGSVQFDNTNRRLAHQVHELVCSLGYRAVIREGRARLNGRDCGPKWKVSFSTADDVFRLDRKRLVHAKRSGRHNPERTRVRYIVDVRAVPSVPVRCITVNSPNRLYLAGKTFIPTHNTVVLRALAVEAARLGIEVQIIDPKRIEMRGLRGWPGVSRIETTAPGMIDLLESMYAEMMNRYADIEAGRVQRDQLRPILVILDEYLILVRLANRHWNQTKDKGQRGTKHPALEQLQELAALARSARIHLCIGVQRPDATLFDDGARDNFRFRVSLGPLSQQGAMMLWGNPRVGTDLDPKARGRATAAVGQSHREVQVFWLPDPAGNALSPAERDQIAALRPPEAMWPAEQSASRGDDPDNRPVEQPDGDAGDDHTQETIDTPIRELAPGMRILAPSGSGDELAPATIEAIDIDQDDEDYLAVDYVDDDGELGSLSLPAADTLPLLID